MLHHLEYLNTEFQSHFIIRKGQSKVNREKQETIQFKHEKNRRLSRNMEFVLTLKCCHREEKIRHIPKKENLNSQ